MVEARVESCELCIVGSGIAGLNVLAVAARYLSPRDRVLLVDRRHAAGGMWTDVYPYVRLHQPHPFFTAGDIPWNIGKPRSYLASRDEVLGHFRHCLDTLATRAQLEEVGGYDYVSHEEVGANGSTEAHVRFTSVDGGPPLQVKAKRCIKAFGNAIPTNDRLPLSSAQVKSISPDFDDIFSDAMKNSAAPVYVVGGGKTGMDTAHALITRFPGKKVNLLIGRGTVFASRDLLFPSGQRRWLGGRTSLEAFLDLSRR